MDRILVVDDDEAVRRVVRERLKAVYEVFDTADPSEAISLALKAKPKCVLLDLLMPGLTGFELCKTLSTLTLTQKIPVLVLSGNPASEFLEFCSHLGAKDYFQKRIDFLRLRSRIAELVRENLPALRPELRLAMHVVVELRGLNRRGKAFHEITETNNVSVNGFCCPCSVSLEPKSLVEVFLRSADSIHRVGRAKVIYGPRQGHAVGQYGFHFTQRPVEWLL
jgi:CheY-like chemotaxis protein